MKRIANVLFVLLSCMLFAYGCGGGGSLPALSAQREGTAIVAAAHRSGDAVAAADRHLQTAQTAVQEVAVSTTDQASRPKLTAASNDIGNARQNLANASADNSIVEVGVERQTEELVATTTNLDTAETKLQKATTENAGWRAAWFGGRALAVIHWAVGISVLLTILLFVLEFGLGANIHPLTWAISGLSYVVAAAVRIVKATVAFLTKVWQTITSRISSPALPVTSPSVASSQAPQIKPA